MNQKTPGLFRVPPHPSSDAGGVFEGKQGGNKRVFGCAGSEGPIKKGEEEGENVRQHWEHKDREAGKAADKTGDTNPPIK